jgi:hypothetical protein
MQRKKQKADAEKDAEFQAMYSEVLSGGVCFEGCLEVYSEVFAKVNIEVYNVILSVQCTLTPVQVSIFLSWKDARNSCKLLQGIKMYGNVFH